MKPEITYISQWDLWVAQYNGRYAYCNSKEQAERWLEILKQEQHEDKHDERE